MLEDFGLERSLPTALASKQFVVHFQGIHEPVSLAVKSVEALVRWHKLGMRVTAEGVEAKEQLRILRDGDCDYVQGFFLTRPMVADQLLDACRSIVARRRQNAASLMTVDDGGNTG